MLGAVGDHILYKSVPDQIQNLQNCSTTPNKNLGGEGASDTCHKAPVHVNFLDDDILHCCLYS